MSPGPARAVEYHLIQRTGRWAWWRPVVGTLAVVLLVLVVAQAALLAAFAAGLSLLGSGDVSGAISRIVDTGDVTPTGLAFLNLSLAAAIPITMAVCMGLHGLAPGWLASVAGRLRWRWLLTCFGLSLVALFATLVVSSVLPASAEGEAIGGGLNDWTTTTRDFALVVLFLTPLQAAGEEYVFRGYLTQVFGGVFAGVLTGVVRSRVAAVVIPSVLFALAHGAQDAPIFFDRFAFGIVAGILVIATGGLEAGIAMHVLNNFLAFGLALAFSDMTSALNPSGGTWWSIPVTLTQSLVYLGLALWAARRLGARLGVRATVESTSATVPQRVL